MNDRRSHWQKVHQSKPAEELSWFQRRPEVSLALIQLAGCGPSARILDVGGGASRLVDALLDAGYRNVSVLDIASSAFEEPKRRLAERASSVQWVEADITAAPPLGTFDLWHDRAVFHFLTDANDRAAYADTLRTTLRLGGHAIIATFAEDGPTQCSGLPVVRYSPASLIDELGQDFELIEVRFELHRTPAGREQSFVYCLLKRCGFG
jgi:SAM-dependent methyltransferase